MSPGRVGGERRREKQQQQERVDRRTRGCEAAGAKRSARVWVRRRGRGAAGTTVRSSPTPLVSPLSSLQSPHRHNASPKRVFPDPNVMSCHIVIVLEDALHKIEETDPVYR
ncbi:hypothetical protein WMY93_017003 [Mugilogobius chulae]|uniref:Uncharacterized protein n=1 Tax=Mugilogobius chulae TaxID=88201 RepID=A0AAW0NME7_9GOBI